MEVTEYLIGIANVLLPTFIGFGLVFGFFFGFVPVMFLEGIIHLAEQWQEFRIARREKRKAKKDAEKEGGEE